MRVLVCGGRDYNDVDGFYCWMDQNLDLKPSDVIISGMAKGADTLAAEYARDNNLELEEYYADWDTYGKAAGYIRNKTMLEDGKPDLVIAFPGGKGTAMMKKIAREAGVEVIEVE